MKLSRLFSAIIVLILLSCSLASCGSDLIKFTMYTDSMEPFIEVRSTVYVEEVDPDTLAVGDIIAYEQEFFINNEEAETIIKVNRIVDITDEGYFIIRGDNAPEEYSETVYPSNIIGKYVKHKKSILADIFY